MKNALLAARRPIIYLITKGNLTPQNFAAESAEIYETIRIAAETEISFVQIREKNLTARLIYELTAEAVKIASKSETEILVNDRADIALAANAGGVHLTANSLRPKIIRRYFPPDFIVGVSAHSPPDLEKAQREKADYATFSPIFSSPGKITTRGLDNLEKVCRKTPDFPIIALGGIDETNYESVLNAGAAGFAAIRFLNDADNLRESALKLKK